MSYYYVWLLLLLLCSAASSFLSIKTPSAKMIILSSRTTTTLATTTTRDDDSSVEQQQQHVCSECSAVFDSRNSMFRHVRSEHVAWGEQQQAVVGGGGGNVPDRKAALCLGYMTNSTEAIQQLKDAIVLSIPDVETVDATLATTSSITTAMVMDQDDCCGSTGDVVVISYKSRYQITPDLIKSINNGLPEQSVQALQVTELSSKSRLRADTSCTQYIYHYLMPLAWLPGGQEATTWWLEKEKAQSNNSGGGGGHVSRITTKPPLLKQLKQVLSSLEALSSSSNNSNTSEHPVKPAKPGRFGTLANKQRLSFHNYHNNDDDYSSSSGNNIDYWKSIDRMQVVDFVSSPENDQVSVVIEMRGDSPLPVLRIIGAIVAILQEWLPANFFELSTQPGISLLGNNVLPLAPPFHYVAGCRYDFDEVRRGHKLFENTDRLQNWKQQLQDNHWSKQLVNTDDQSWLKELEIKTCPAILEQLLLQDNNVRAVTDYLDATPEKYRPVLSQLNQIVQTGRWPATSAARSRILRAGCSTADPKTGYPVGTFTVVNSDLSTEGLLRVQGNQLFPLLVEAVFAVESQLIAAAAASNNGEQLEHRSPSTHCAINFNAAFTPHLDSGSRGGDDPSLIVGMGDYEGGNFVVDGIAHDIRYRPLEFDGWNQWHWTDTFQGDRFTLVFFTPALRDKNSAQDPTTLTANARQLIQSFGKLKGVPTIDFRSESTDTLVIQEMLEGTCVYNNCPPMGLYPADFSPKDHVVLDVGAHIGVFSWYALGEGCKRVIAFEPEESNFELLSKNMQHFGTKSVVYQAAVAHGDVGKRQFVLGANNQLAGATNTWRHSLMEYSTYDVEGEESSVDCLPFFGPEGVLKDEVTFVKLDCEGAELDILLSEEAADSMLWRDVTRLVFEWSFTKNRSIKKFRSAINNLRQAGFEVRYEGQGAWWDTASDGSWPYHNDLLVFALRPMS
jgi:FkbM family methyltransferase